MGTRIMCVLALAWVSACRQAAPAKAPPPPVVLVDQVAEQPVTEYAEAVADVDGYVNVEIRARVSGYLKSQNVADGARVKRGDLLFTIEPNEFQAKLAAARGALTRARAAKAISQAQLARQEQLVAMQAVSREAYDQALAAGRDALGQEMAAEAAVRQAELDLSYTQMRSPVDGIMGFALVRAGNLVGNDEPTLLTTVSQIDPLRVRFALSELDYLAYAKGQKLPDGRDLAWAERQLQALRTRGETEDGHKGIELLLADGSVYAERGVLIARDREVHTDTGTIQLEALFPNPERTLRPGQYGRVRVVRGGRERPALVVTEKALVSVQGSYSLAVVDADDKVRMRRVQVGARSGDARVITEGVSLGERVVVAGLQKVRDGMLVTPKPADGESTSLPPHQNAPKSASLWAE